MEDINYWEVYLLIYALNAYINNRQNLPPLDEDEIGRRNVIQLNNALFAQRMKEYNCES